MAAPRLPRPGDLEAVIDALVGARPDPVSRVHDVAAALAGLHEREGEGVGGGDPIYLQKQVNIHVQKKSSDDLKHRNCT